MNPELVWMVAIVWIGLKPEWEVWIATGISDLRNESENRRRLPMSQMGH
jgi:hypothetical protein